MPICHPGNISSQYVIPVNIEKMEHFFNVDPESTEQESVSANMRRVGVHDLSD